ncbi:MAG: ribosomal-processing cysteine protease Prp [Lachnospiraceae bacterium]|nr:ribosomal-processing cysteine protease Prp [Lachnospiraceae bacterium]
MIRASIIKKDGNYKAFSFLGHAEYSEAGTDIVCAAASVLIINTANAIESLTDNEIKGSDEDGIFFEFPNPPDEKGRLLIDAMILGLEDIRKKYGEKYLTLKYEEV